MSSLASEFVISVYRRPVRVLQLEKPRNSQLMTHKTIISFFFFRFPTSHRSFHLSGSGFQGGKDCSAQPYILQENIVDLRKLKRFASIMF
mmetsp:Transcript_24424/g.55048  ORF Transcript_24424/g.55048 Transcript_24424/m.55048 type:complete len:90 (-) Transcript_24424:597-866(-)